MAAQEKYLDEIKEADITINGVKLGVAHSAAIRRSINEFLITLTSEGLGNRPIDKVICANYIQSIVEIQRVMR